MQNKKVVLIVLLFIIGFGLVYLSLAGKLFDKKTKNQDAKKDEIANLDLPKLKCDFGSDQDAYNEASNNNNLDACSCIGDEAMRDMCTTSTMDIILYGRALDNLDITLCENIRTQVHKDSCNSVVKDSIEQLKKNDPQRLADIYFLSSNEKSIELYEELTASDQKNIINYTALALAYAEKGLREQEQGGDQSSYVNKAFETIEKAKAIDNNSSEVYRIEAYINEIKPDYTAALNLYNKSIELNDKNVMAYVGRGHVNRMIGSLEMAVEDLKKAATMDTEKNITQIYSNLCNLENSRSNYEEAVKNCKIVVENENADPIFKSSAYQTIASILSLGGDLAQAKNNMLKAKLLTPRDSNLFVKLSKLNILEKRYDDSETNAREAIQISPTKATSYLALSHALYMQEKYKDSIAAAQKGLELVKDDVSLLTPSKPAIERDLNYSISNNYGQLGDSAKQKEYEQKGTDILNLNK